MIIRPMEPEDADSVAQIEKDSFTQPWSRQGFLDAMRLPENIMLVAQEDGEILGYQCTYVSFDEGDRRQRQMCIRDRCGCTSYQMLAGKGKRVRC